MAWRQAIISTQAELLSAGPLETNFSEDLFKMQNISFPKLHLKVSSAKWRPFRPGGVELIAKNPHQGPLLLTWSNFNPTMDK